MMGNRTVRSRILPLLLAAIVQATGFALAANAAFATSAEAELSVTQKLESAARSERYAGIVFDRNDWTEGRVISKDPYAVVVSGNSASPTARVRVWTGLVTRDGDDLLTYWDELWVDGSGKVSNAVTGDEVVIERYFRSGSQEEFRTKAYLGRMPWADIPTDAEAAARGVPKVTDGKTVNLYGIVFETADLEAVTDSPEVREAPDIPDVVPTFRPWKEVSEAAVPQDVQAHWAKDVTQDLLKQAIVEGYEEGTIRPDLLLSRGEFVALLGRAIGLSPLQAEAQGYADLREHWSEGMVAALQEAGVLSKHPAALQFQPDAKMRRIDMVEMIHNALEWYGVSSPAAGADFSDVGSLSAAQKAALERVVGTGIVGGYPDGTFRPDGFLTRAEAFAVISRLIHL